MNRGLEEILLTSQALSDKGEFQAAIDILGSLECIMATWMRGRTYLAAADKLSKSIMYIYCRTEEMKQQYETLLFQAQIHLHKTAGLLVDAGGEVQNYLNQYLWGQITQVDHKICETRPLYSAKESYNDDWVEEEEANSFESYHTDDLIDELSAWQL